jgi:hypothetical protein
MIQLGSIRSQTGLDVPQALAVRQLSKGQTQKLIATREPSRSLIAPITPHTRVELVPRQKLHELRKNQRPDMHNATSSARRNCRSSEIFSGFFVLSSNRARSSFNVIH